MADHGVQHYVKVWGTLVVLLIISILGPMIGHPAITLVTAFGIALVKAYLVAKNFMHVNVQPGFVGYLLSTCLVFMLLFFAGSSPDVMKKHGDNWQKPHVTVVGPLTPGAGHGEHGGHGMVEPHAGY